MPRCVVADDNGIIPVSANRPGTTQRDMMLRDAVRAGAEARERKAQPKLLQVVKVVPRKRKSDESDATSKAPPALPITKRIKRILIVTHGGAHECLSRPARHRCMWDLGEFYGIPFVTPTRYIEGRDVYRTKGIYCSAGCAKRALINVNDGISQLRLSWFSDLVRRFYGFGYRRLITPAPDRETLDIFGGPYTLEEFRAKSNSGIVSTVVTGSIVFEESHVEELDLKSARAHVEWIKAGREALPPPAAVVVKSEPPPSPQFTPPAPIERPMAPLPRASPALAAQWFGRMIVK
jgi:hypothetical protein